MIYVVSTQFCLNVFTEQKSPLRQEVTAYSSRSIRFVCIQIYYCKKLPTYMMLSLSLSFHSVHGWELAYAFKCFLLLHESQVFIHTHKCRIITLKTLGYLVSQTATELLRFVGGHQFYVGYRMVVYRVTTIQTYIYIYIFIHSLVRLTTGPKPLPKRALDIVRSRASSFKWEYPLLSLTHCGRVTQICVFNTKLVTFASSP